jgi:hypothetical protein
VFLNFLAADRDRNCVEVATNSELTTGAGDQDDAVALALDSNVTATALDVGKLAVSRGNSSGSQWERRGPFQQGTETPGPNVGTQKDRGSRHRRDCRANPMRDLVSFSSRPD